MMYENDKLIIPEEIKKMSVSELKCERERLYKQIRKSEREIVTQTKVKKDTEMFLF